jgi:hypothetical protein
MMRLIRSGEDNKNAERDDLIAIVPLDEDSYGVYYTSGDWDSQITHYVDLTGDELDTYIENLFFLLSRDRDPFRSLQVNIPCMPAVLLLVSDLKKNGIKRHLREILPLLHSCIKVKF